MKTRKHFIRKYELLAKNSSEHLSLDEQRVAT